jgi:hypothetical protein
MYYNETSRLSVIAKNEGYMIAHFLPFYSCIWANTTIAPKKIFYIVEYQKINKYPFFFLEAHKIFASTIIIKIQNYYIKQLGNKS